MKTAVVGAFACASALAMAQAISFVPVKTREGCEVQVPGPRPKLFNGIDAQGRPVPPLEVWTWSGACVGGTGFGPGRLRYQIGSGEAATVEVKQLTLDGGYPLGFEYAWIEQTQPPGKTMVRVHFWHEGRMVAFTDGWGLDTAPYAQGVSQVVEPRRVPAQPVGDLMQALHAPTSSAMLFNAQKVMTPPGGGGVELVSHWELREWPRAGSASHAQKTPCPVPTDVQSCQALVERAAGPLRDEIIGFIRQAKPTIDAAYARIQGSLAATRSAAGAAGAGAIAPAAPVAAPAARSDLNTLPVGALFAVADEAVARGDRSGAREALRALLRRFPDHALAARAATLLSTLQTP